VFCEEAASEPRTVGDSISQRHGHQSEVEIVASTPHTLNRRKPVASEDKHGDCNTKKKGGGGRPARAPIWPPLLFSLPQPPAPSPPPPSSLPVRRGACGYAWPGKSWPRRCTQGQRRHDKGACRTHTPACVHAVTAHPALHTSRARMHARLRLCSHLHRRMLASREPLAISPFACTPTPTHTHAPLQRAVRVAHTRTQPSQRLFGGF
jgi:hypothetical protein